MGLYLGTDVTSGVEVDLPLENLRRHVAVLGSSGSGKTVICKVLVEEAVRNGVPVIAVDPQGDVASLALRESVEVLQAHGVSPAIQDDFFTKARVTIFTPASSKGVPLSVDPLRLPTEDLPHEEAVLALDMTAASLVGILGYDPSSADGRSARAAIFTVLDAAQKRDAPPRDLEELARRLIDPAPETARTLGELISRKKIDELGRKLRLLTVGASSLLFQMGVKLDLDSLLERREGRVPVNIVYLNSLASEADKQFFLTSLLREVYLWMLQHPSPKVQLLLYVDEVAPYIPPYPRNPPPKQAYALLFKQARKYGVSLLAATQNITDIDYKALGQVNTWCLGRLAMSQDVARVSKIVHAIDPTHAEAILGSLPSLAASEFFLVSPDVRERIVRFRSRWLASQHRTLEEGELAAAMAPLGIATAVPAVAAPEREAPTAAEAPATRVEEGLPSDLARSITAALAELRAAVTIETLAQKLNRPPDSIRADLGRMVRAGALAKGRIPKDDQELFWISSAGFQPKVGLTRELFELPMRIPQVDAVRRAAPLLVRERLSKLEEVEALEFGRLPLWMIRCEWTTKGLLSSPRQREDDYFVHAGTGAFMTIEGKEIRFERVARQAPDRLHDLSDEEGVTLLRRLPGEIGGLPGIRVPVWEAFDVLRRTFGVRPVDGHLALLPLWKIRIRQIHGAKSRTVTMDAVTGRWLAGEF